MLNEKIRAVCSPYGCIVLIMLHASGPQLQNQLLLPFTQSYTYTQTLMFIWMIEIETNSGVSEVIFTDNVEIFLDRSNMSSEVVMQNISE